MKLIKSVLINNSMVVAVESMIQQSVHEILQRNLERVDNILSSSLPSSAVASTTSAKWAATKERQECIKWVMSTTSTAHSFLESIFTILIIYLTLPGITQNFINLYKLFKLFRITSLIRMILNTSFTVSFLDIFWCTILGTPKIS